MRLAHSLCLLQADGQAELLGGIEELRVYEQLEHSHL